MSTASELIAEGIAELSRNALREEDVRKIVKLELEENGLNTEAVRKVMDKALEKAIKILPPKKIELHNNGEVKEIEGVTHPMFETLVKVCSAKKHSLLVGPAGAGKTWMAKQVSEALDFTYYVQGACATKYDFTGHYDPKTGGMTKPPARQAAEDGGLLCMDEIDAGHPGALLSLNALLTSAFTDFGNDVVEVHKNFVCIACANTYGTGADRQYVGRNQLDAATLDRFVVIDVNYDEAMERQIAGNDDWVDFVQKMRRAAESLKLRTVISPRASYFGAALIEAGIDLTDVAKLTVWKGIDEATVKKIKTEAKNV